MHITTNRDELVQMAVQGEISNPVLSKGRRWRIGPDGKPRALPGVGGITYNCKVGDSAINWQADHMEPGVSMKNSDKNPNAALNFLACLGNTATIMGGDAKGDTGTVTGKHGGINHVLVDFPQSTLEKLAIGDKIQIRARGQGLELEDYPGIALASMSPRLLDRMPLQEKNGHLAVGVTHVLPAAVMGSGVGPADSFAGDHDLQLSDEAVVEEYGTEDLRLGDLVAIRDADHSYGRVYKKGAIAIGAVIHSCCVQAGHGPGLTTLMTSTDGLIQPMEDEEANMGRYLEIGRYRSEED